MRVKKKKKKYNNLPLGSMSKITFADRQTTGDTDKQATIESKKLAQLS